MSFKQKMQEIFREYQDQVNPDPVDLNDVAGWAIANRKWLPRPVDMQKIFASEMADALREEIKTDAKGRRYRTKHAVRFTKDGRQGSFWADIDSAPRSHMQKAFGQRREQIVGDCVQLKIDVDHFNDLHPRYEPEQLILDFTDDVAERLFKDDAA